MARDLIVRIIGDDRSLKSAMLRDQKLVASFGNTTTTSMGKADAAFKRTQGIVAGGFAGGLVATAAIAGIKSLVDAASNSQQVLGQTKVALQATGKSWDDYGKQIESAVAAQSKLGFDDEALLQTFSLFVRQTNDVGRALAENNLAMDVARARFVSLEQAASLVNKAALGQAGSLRRLGIDTKGATTGTEFLALLTEKYGGSARAAGNNASTAFARAQVSIQNVKETLGAALLPTVADVAVGLADAADDANALAAQLKKLGAIKIPPIHIPFVADFGGGTVGGGVGRFAGEAVKTAVKLQFAGIGFTVASEIAKLFRDETTAATPDLANEFARSINTMFQSALDTATANVKPSTKVKGFGSGLTPKDLFGPLIKDIPKALQEALLDAQIAGDPKKIRAVLERQLATMEEALNDPRLQRPGRIKIKGTIKAIQDAIAAVDAQIAQSVQDASDKSQAAADKAAGKRRDAFAKLLGSLQLGVDRAGLTATLNDDVAALQKLAAGLRKQIKAGVDVQAAQSQLVSVVGQIATKQAEIRQRAADAAQARQFKALGLSATGGDLVPGVDNLRKRLASALAKIDSGDVKVGSKLASRLRAARKLIQTEGSNLTEETRRQINEFIKAANGDGKEITGPITKGSGLNTKKLLAGLGLDPNQIRDLRGRLSGVNSSGLALAGAPRLPTGNFATSQPVVVENHNTITLDGEVVARNVTKSQQVTKRRNPPQKRGPNRSGV